MTFYEKYKPFRNYMRRFDLVPSLVDLWRYAQHIDDGHPLPLNYAVGGDPLCGRNLKDQFYPWDLAILARELILNTTGHGDRTLGMYSHLANAMNHIRKLDEAAFTDAGPQSIDMLYELNRIAHRQFPWQIKDGVAPMMRAFKVFGASAVEEVVVRELNMTTRQFLLLGIAIYGHFLKQPGLSTNQDYGVLGISREASNDFFRRITSTIEDLRAETIKLQLYNQDWLYTWNPLEATPLVSFDPKFPERVLCPIPRYLARRASAGIFYDLVKSKGFDQSYGDSFQSYIGEVIEATCPSTTFTALGEEEYYVGNNLKHGADWVLSDSTGHIFVECKTKRLTLSAKTQSNTEAMERDLEVMAQAVVQNYRNIDDAVKGKTRWKADGRPIYPLVLTLEDWFVFSPRVREMLNKHVLQVLTEKGMREEMLDEMPFTIASAHEFEITSQVIAQRSIFSVMSKKVTPDKRGFSLLPFASGDFPDEMRRIKWCLFAEDWERLVLGIPYE